MSDWREHAEDAPVECWVYPLAAPLPECASFGVVTVVVVVPGDDGEDE